MSVVPRPKEGTSPTAAPGTTILPRGHGELLLVADDEEPIRIVARRTLVAFGYRVLLAAHGAEAVRHYAAQTHEIAAVITDMAMPGLDGRAAIAAMARLNPAIRVIAMSGYIVPESEGGNPMPPQVCATLEKPFTTETLLGALDVALGHREPPAAAPVEQDPHS